VLLIADGEILRRHLRAEQLTVEELAADARQNQTTTKRHPRLSATRLRFDHPVKTVLTSLGGEADDGRVVRELPAHVQDGSVDLADRVGR
jgi:hypothetical protein